MKTELFKRVILKAVFLTALLVLSTIVLQAQEIRVRNIAQLTSDISARSAARMDANNKECAIVRVNIPSLKTIDFGNAIVGKAEYNAGEYLLYVSEGTKQIPISVSGYKDGIIDFDQYGVSVESKNVYRVTLYIDNGKVANSGKHGSMKITTEPESSYVMMDGMPIGETPLSLKDVPAGQHVISFPNTSGYTLPDQTITVNENETFEHHYVLKENTDVFDWEEEIPLDGSDSDGTGWWPVKYKIKTENGKRGIQTYWGDWVVPCGEFEYVDNGSCKIGNDDVFMVGNYNNGELRKGVYQPGKGLIIPCEYSYFYFQPASENYIIVCKANKSRVLDKWGLVDLNGQIIVPCTYESIEYYDNEKFFVLRYKVNEKTKYKILNISDKNAILNAQEEYDYITGFYEGMAGAIKDNNKFIINSKGQIVESIAPIYSYGDSYGSCYTEGILCLKKGGILDFDRSKYGVLNSSGKELTSFVYKREAVRNGWIILENDEEWIVVDKNEHIYKVLKEGDEDNGPKIEGQYLCLKKNGKYGLLDTNGNTVLPFEYDRIREEKGLDNVNYFVTSKGDKKTIWDESFHELLTIDDMENVWISTIKDGIIVLEDYYSHCYGFMNFKGEILAGCLFDSEKLAPFYVNHNNPGLLVQHGLGLLCIGDRCGFVNKDGEIVIPLIYPVIVPFNDGTVYGMKPDGTWVDMKLEQYDKK